VAYLPAHPGKKGIKKKLEAKACNQRERGTAALAHQGDVEPAKQEKGEKNDIKQQKV